MLVAERPRYYETEEKECTGLCLLKKMEALDKKLEKKNNIFEKKMKKKPTISEDTEPKKKKAPCTGRCALMRRKHG